MRAGEGPLLPSPAPTHTHSPTALRPAAYRQGGPATTRHRAREGRPRQRALRRPPWSQYRRLVRVRLRARFTELHNLHNRLQLVPDACSPQTSTHTAVSPVEHTPSPGSPEMLARECSSEVLRPALQELQKE